MWTPEFWSFHNVDAVALIVTLIAIAAIMVMIWTEPPRGH